MSSFLPIATSQGLSSPPFGRSILRYDLRSPDEGQSNLNKRTDHLAGKTLCVDIGGNQIKAAVLQKPDSIESLRNVKTVVLQSASWFNESLPLLFERDSKGVIQRCFKSQYEKIAIGISGPIINGSKYLDVSRRIPYEIKTACEERAKCPVLVENDAIVWSRGLISWKKMIQQDIAYPCLVVTLEAGVGVVVMNSEDDLTLIETHALKRSFSRLRECSIEQPIKNDFRNQAIHSYLGVQFFDWLFKSNPNFESDEIQDIFNCRFAAFLLDLREYLSDEMFVTLQSVCVGGGNSRLIASQKISKEIGVSVEAISPAYLSEFRVPVETISLLGCLDNDKSPRAKVVPSPKELWDLQFEKMKYTNF